jgi:DHA1 family inner membrane transport protein
MMEMEHMTTTSGRRAVVVLFLGAFVMGSSELLLVGVLDLVARDLAVPVPRAGWLVTAYALGLAIGGPILTASTTRLDRRRLLLGALVLATATNLVATLTTSYTLMLAARTLTGALQGLFLAAAFAVAVAVVPSERTGRAIGLVISGTAVSTAVGVPLGTLAGHLLSWRGSYGAVVILLGLTVIAAFVAVPPVAATGQRAAGQARYAFAPRVLAVLGLCALVFGATYAALTYIVPFLGEVTGVDGTAAGGFLLAYGAAAAVGSFGGGRFADRDAGRALVVGALGTAGSLAALALLGWSPWFVAVLLVCLGACAMSTGPSLQYRVLMLAGPGAPLAQSLPASAVNLGIAGGSLAGGVALDVGGAGAAVLTGLAIAVAAVPTAWATRRLSPPVPAEPGDDRVPSAA